MDLPGGWFPAPQPTPFYMTCFYDPSVTVNQRQPAGVSTVLRVPLYTEPSSAFTMNNCLLSRRATCDQSTEMVWMTYGGLTESTPPLRPFLLPKGYLCRIISITLPLRPAEVLCFHKREIQGKEAVKAIRCRESGFKPYRCQDSDLATAISCCLNTKLQLVFH